MINLLFLKKEPLQTIDYLIFLIPISSIFSLLLYNYFNLFHKNIYNVAVITTSMYAATFIVTPMNSRIRNLYVTLIHIFLGTMLIIIYLQLKNDAAFYNSNNQNILKNNFFPISAIVYLHIARIIYILITKNEPITTFKGDKKGDWNATAKREITNNDIKWSVISKLILAAILISIAASTV